MQQNPKWVIIKKPKGGAHGIDVHNTRNGLAFLFSIYIKKKNYQFFYQKSSKKNFYVLFLKINIH